MTAAMHPTAEYLLRRPYAVCLEAGISYIHDAPIGSEWNGMPLAEFIQGAGERLCSQIRKTTEPTAPLAESDIHLLRSSLESFIDAKRVWQEMRDSEQQSR